MREGLVLRNLTKRMPGFELRANFQVGAEERVVLTGPSGSGKTTLLRLIAGLEREDAGAVELFGNAIQGLPPERRDIGFVFQDHALFPAMKVIDNVSFGLKMRGVSKEECRKQGFEWLEKVGMRTRAEQSIQGLSGGERQRLAVVRALIWKPKLLLLDEPFSSLDSALKFDLIEEVKRLHSLNPVPLLIVSHNEKELELFGGKVLKIKDENGIRSVG